MPLPVLQVLPDLARDQKHFASLGEEAGDWIEQFGFLRTGDWAEQFSFLREQASAGLPVGFTISNYRPRSGAPSPVRFVGIGCATCHVSEIRRPDGTKFFVIGTGNASLNLFAWLDAFQSVMLDQDHITMTSIKAAYQQKYRRELGFEETQMIRLWLSGFRRFLKENLPKFDEPYGAGQSLAPEVTPTGPGRTQPFRTLVRGVLERPGTTMKVYTKIAPVFHEDWQEWAQVDGSIRGLNSRSALAVLAAGATVHNMAVPEIVHNIVQATNYVRALRGPSFEEVFPDLAQKLDRDAIERGRGVFMTHCNDCHGHPEPSGKWVKDGKRHDEIVSFQEIGTDPERVTFRYFDRLPDALFAYFTYFPTKHPFRFPREDLRPGPAGQTKGYINKPIDATFTRAPYLHNASILTLAELINLVPRRPTFCRGRNTYDPAWVGLHSPEGPDKMHYFQFNTQDPGNANQGHNYPWRYKDELAGWNEQELTDLLEYLKTL